MVRHAMTLIRVLVSAELLTRSRMTHANQASVLQSQRGTMVHAHNRVGVAQIVSNAHRVFVIVQMWSCSSPTLTSELHAPHVQQHAFDMPPRVCRQCLLSDIVVVALHHPSMNCSSYRCIQYSPMLYVRLMHRYSVLYVLRTDTHTHTHTCNLPEAELYKHMTYTRADVRSCTRGQHLSSHRRGARVLAHLRRPYRRAA